MSTIKLVHMCCALLTISFFALRGLWMLQDSSLRQKTLVRVSPHVIDTVLLLTGLYMAIQIYPAFYSQPWLQVKLACVVLYIFAGSVALKYGSTKMIRCCALLAALLIFTYIILVARAHSPLPLL